MNVLTRRPASDVTTDTASEPQADLPFGSGTTNIDRTEENVEYGIAHHGGGVLEASRQYQLCWEWFTPQVGRGGKPPKYCESGNGPAPKCHGSAGGRRHDIRIAADGSH
jgi:hypothetical protein